jgi:Small integral membrane protein (DUF2273)
VTSPKLIGLALGLWLGFVWVIWDFSDMVLVALVGLVGYLIGRLVAGDLDLGPLAGRLGLRR